MTNRTNWDALRARTSATGSLPPAENIDRAQVAALGSAGPAAGTGTVTPEQLAAEIVERAEAYSLDGFALKGRVELRAYVAGQIRPLVTDLEVERIITAVLNRQQERLIADSKELSELRAAVRRWHAGAPSWNAEDDLYREMLQLAGVESGTPAGPPVAAAGAGLDVERLVGAMCQMSWEYHVDGIEDESLSAAHIKAAEAAWHLGPEAGERAGFRALVLTALGLDATTTTRPQADPSEEAQDVE